MNNLFVFCVGGTGLRVMKSLVMLLASGVEIEGYNIVPILIDPHKDLDELKNLKILIGRYTKIYRAIHGNQPNNNSGFFKTNIISLDRLANNNYDDESDDNYDFDSRIDSTFSEHINLNNLSTNDVNRQFIELLYSEVNFNKKLSVGFKGSPNVGCVVLDSIDSTNWFRTFTSQVQAKDKIFIISSMFGGTGAAGFPILVKKLEKSNNQNVKNALKGGLAVQPYFNLDTPPITSENQEIDSSTFATKTKSALLYYTENLKIDHLYYIGDKMGVDGKLYKNDEEKQHNEAHIIELIGATSIIHFAKQNINTQKIKQEYSIAIADEKDNLNIETIGSGFKDYIESLANLYILSKVLEFLPSDKAFPHKSLLRINNEELFNSDDYKVLISIINDFNIWLNELSTNRRGFEPFTLKDKDNNFNPIIGKHAILKKLIKDIPFGLSYYMIKIIESGNSLLKRKTDIKNPLSNLIHITSEGIANVNNELIN